MKKYSLLVAMAVSLLACNVKVSTGDNAEKEAATEAASAETPASAPTASVIKDPVCGMSQEGEKFTEFVVSGTDTTWFCSSHCKEQFEKNPEKYKKAEAPKS